MPRGSKAGKRRGRYDKSRGSRFVAKPTYPPTSASGPAVLTMTLDEFDAAVERAVKARTDTEATKAEASHRERVGTMTSLYAEPMLDTLTELNERRKKAGKREVTQLGVLSAAEQLARLELHLERLSNLQARGMITAEEAKSVPSVSKEMRALRLELGLTFTRDKDGDLKLEDEEEL